MPLLTPNYLLTQLQTGSFLGIVAAGMMMVILLGHIDLSVPWTMTAAAIMATSVGGSAAIPTGLAVGLAGRPLQRPRRRLSAHPLDDLHARHRFRDARADGGAHTGGFAPSTTSTPLMRFLGAGQVLGIPMAVFVWACIALVIAIMLKRTGFGRAVYATGNSEAASYLSGIRTRRVIIGAFMVSGLCSAAAGVLLAGYSNKAFQGMGNAYLLPAIAAVVLGGTNILGGRGRFAGTVVGVMLIVAAELRAVDHADAGGRPPDHLWRRDHRHAARLWPHGEGDGLSQARITAIRSAGRLPAQPMQSGPPGAVSTSASMPAATSPAPAIARRPGVSVTVRSRTKPRAASVTAGTVPRPKPAIRVMPPSSEPVSSELNSAA